MINYTVKQTLRFLLLPFVLLFWWNGYSQESELSTITSEIVDPLSIKSSCSQKLKEIQKNYELGLLEGIPNALQPCISNGFTRIERQQAYRLMILTYLFLDEIEKANEYMNILLTSEPDYVPNASLDPIEYIRLFNSFRVQPFISFGVLAGLNQTNPRLVNNFGVGNTKAFPTTYQEGVNFNIGVSIDFLLYRQLFLTTDGFLMLRNYISTSQILQNSKTTSTETYTSLSIPISLKYMVGGRKLKVFIRAGAAIDLMLTAQSQMIRKNTVTDQNDFAGPNVNLIFQRNIINLAAFAGAGITYKLGYGYLTLDGRYYYGLSNIAKDSERYVNTTTQITNYGYLDNDLSWNNIQLNVGYMYSLFKVKKVKSKIQ